MKFVTTAQPYRRLVLETDDNGEPTKVVSGTPLEVSDADADTIVKLGESAGVAVRVTDKAEEADTSTPVVQATPDLSAGVAAITGTGAAVNTTDDTSTGDDAGKTRKGK